MLLTFSQPSLNLLKFLSNRNVSPLRRSIRKVIRSKPVIFMIVFLVIIYTILIFVDISMNQLMTEDQLNSSDNILRYIELGILIVFLVEIILNAYGTGVKVSVIHA